jgi:hypothetical protein
MSVIFTRTARFWIPTTSSRTKVSDPIPAARMKISENFGGYDPA